jgi:ribosomal protein S18 acetylase RimI-like enzyme
VAARTTGCASVQECPLSRRACEAGALMRRADASDWERLRDVRLRALATDPYAFLETLEEARMLPDVHWRERATPSETQATFVEERDGSFAAMASVFVASDPASAYLVGMWVAPELRGTGIAIDLVAHVLDWARDHRRVRVVLSVEPGNGRAARLYEKCGFVEIPQPAELPYEPNADNRFYAYEL